MLALDVELEQYPLLSGQENLADDSFNLLEQAAALTRAFISFCQSVYKRKFESSRSEWKEENISMGWASSTAKPYAKIGEWFQEIEPCNIELLDINTIKSLCSEKFQDILERLKTERLTVAEVRHEMTAINKELRKPKEAPKPVQWENYAKNRRLVIRLEDPDTSVEFEKQFNKFQQQNKEISSPLPFFVKQLLCKNVPPSTFAFDQPQDTWQQSQEEVVTYLEKQADEVNQLQEKIQHCDRIIAQFQDSTNPSERMVARVAKEDKAKLQSQLSSFVVQVV